MAGRWKSFDITGLSESPEAHWMRTVMARPGPQWCSIRLSRPMARRFASAFSRRFMAEASAEPEFLEEADRVAEVDDLVERGALITRSGYAALCRFCRGDGAESIETDLLAQGEAIDGLCKMAGGDGLDVTDIGPPDPDQGTVPTQLLAPEPARSTGAAGGGDGEVIVAIIDDGIGVANNRFRLCETKTRVECFLDMNCQAGGSVPDAATGADPGVGEVAADLNGTTWTKRALDRLLAEHPQDDEAVYRAMGMIDPRSGRRQPLKHAVTHGTHVLDLAGGYDHRDPAEREIARRRPIIAVQLPSDIVVDRSDSRMPQALKNALQWIEDAACTLSERAMAEGRSDGYLPVVLNFSFGVFAGPHDGMGQVEQRISAFIDRYRELPGKPQCEVVLPAGNGLQARAVAHLEAGPSLPDEPLVWRVQPDDKTSSFLQIWLPSKKDRTQQVRVSIKPPRNGPKGDADSELNRALDWTIANETLVRLYHQSVAQPDGGFRERITIAMRPTEPDGDGIATSPAGPWEVRIANDSLEEGKPIDLRIQRDDPIAFERPKGRQSYFDHPDYPMFDPVSGRLINDGARDAGPVRRRGTLSAYATGRDTVVVGGYRRTDGEPVDYSSSGPATSDRPGPNLSAVCEEGPTLRGVLAAGTRTGASVVMNGTSVAAPVVARELADAFACGKTLRDLLEAVEQDELKGIVGPHGVYRKDIPEERQGVGRLVPGHFAPAPTSVDGPADG